MVVSGDVIGILCPFLRYIPYRIRRYFAQNVSGSKSSETIGNTENRCVTRSCGTATTVYIVVLGNVSYLLTIFITLISWTNLSNQLHESTISTILDMSHFHRSSYALSCLVFAYAEGYKGFHKKFAPLVVKRSFTLIIGTRQGNNPLNYLLAPLYSMGLWGATKKRLIVSWGVTTGVALLVAIVKKLPRAPRCILDAGVVVGLTIGSASILYHFARSLVTGKLPDVDACLPNETS